MLCSVGTKVPNDMSCLYGMQLFSPFSFFFFFFLFIQDLGGRADDVGKKGVDSTQRCSGILKRHRG